MSNAATSLRLFRATRAVAHSARANSGADSMVCRASSSTARARVREIRIPQIAGPSVGSVGDCSQSPEPVDNGVRSHQADRGTAVLQGQCSKMPAGSVLGIQGQARSLKKPCAHLRARTRRVGDVEVLGSPGDNPPIACERQRRPFDLPSQQPVSKISVEPAQPFDIHRAVVYPVDLHERPINSPQTKKRRLVRVCESIVHRVYGSPFRCPGVWLISNSKESQSPRHHLKPKLRMNDQLLLDKL